MADTFLTKSHFGSKGQEAGRPASIVEQMKMEQKRNNIRRMLAGTCYEGDEETVRLLLEADSFSFQKDFELASNNTVTVEVDARCIMHEYDTADEAGRALLERLVGKEEIEALYKLLPSVRISTPESPEG